MIIMINRILSQAFYEFFRSLSDVGWGGGGQI